MKTKTIINHGVSYSVTAKNFVRNDHAAGKVSREKIALDEPLKARLTGAFEKYGAIDTGLWEEINYIWCESRLTYSLN